MTPRLIIRLRNVVGRLVVIAALAGGPLALPQWRAEDAAALDAGRPANLGGGLWTAELFPLEPAPPPEREAPPAAWLAQLPAGELAPERLAAYRNDARFCVDPQRLLSPTQRRGLEQWLTQQAALSRQPLKLWVLAPGQTLPGAVTGELAAPEETAAIAVAVWNEPARLQLLGAPWPEGARRQAVEHATQAAAPFHQLQETVMWLSAALFQARLAEPGTAASPAPVATTAPVRSGRWGWWLLALAALGAGGWGAWRWLLRPDFLEPLVFPERHVPSRLAAPYSGGAGAALRWE